MLSTLYAYVDEKNVELKQKYQAFAYDLYVIGIKQEYNQLSNEQINSSRSNINNNVIKSIDKSTKTRHTKSKNKLDKLDNQADKDKYVSDILRSNDNYIVEQLKISDTIINRNAKDLRNELNQKVKTNNIKTTSNVEDKQLELKWDLQSLSNDVPF